jgi:hypothetical protein
MFEHIYIYVHERLTGVWVRSGCMKGHETNKACGPIGKAQMPRASCAWIPEANARGGKEREQGLLQEGRDQCKRRVHG